MSASRIPHQFVLAFAFCIIAIGLSAAIIENTVAVLRQSDATVQYATRELDGISCLSTTTDVMRLLLAYRDDLIEPQGPVGIADPASRAATRHISAIGAAIARVCARDGANRAFDANVAARLDVLRARWAAALGRRRIAPADISAVIATIQPLVAEISGASGISNDPSIDGINFGDALVRFPLALANGSQAAALSIENLGASNLALAPRFAAARLLAQARTAIEVGRQDAEDEMAVNAELAVALERQASDNVSAFQTLEERITDAYVETSGAQPHPTPATLDAELEHFTASSLNVIDALLHDLHDVTAARIDAARRQHEGIWWATIAGVIVEVSLIVTLAWISIVSYQNGRKKETAERIAFDLKRNELEAQLTHANAQAELLRAKAEFRAVFDRAPVGMLIIDRQYRTLETNEAVAAMFSGGADPIDAAGIITDHRSGIDALFSGRHESFSRECQYGDGRRIRWFHVSMSAVHGAAGEALLVIVMLRDISASKLMEEQLVFDAGHDALTGLPNRSCFVAMLQNALDHPDFDAGVFSVVFIDFNDFKTINDSLGHAAGDKFLIEGAARLRDSVRASDIVARIGGDEFAILLYGADRADIEKSVVRLQNVISAPVNIDGQSVASSGSFGIAPGDAGYVRAAEIIRDADTAMYQAKAAGGRNYVVFDASMRERVVRRMRLSMDIVHALDHAEMVLLYQPIIDLHDGSIAGCEALVRWRRADGDAILPSEFIPLAEETGAIFEIGRWVTETACEQLRSWNAIAGSGGLPDMRDNFVMHINLSVPEMHHIDLLSHLAQTLAQSGVRSSQVILEITESMVLKRTEHIRGMLDKLTSAGLRLCIDDFGTGYSSLRYLNELPLHGFKIDRSFVSEDGRDGLANLSIVEMLMVLSRSLDLEVVAEGIETAAQWKQLRDLGCRLGQGFYFARALDATAFTAMLKGYQPQPVPTA